MFARAQSGRARLPPKRARQLGEPVLAAAREAAGLGPG